MMAHVADDADDDDAALMFSVDEEGSGASDSESDASSSSSYSSGSDGSSDSDVGDANDAASHARPAATAAAATTVASTALPGRLFPKADEFIPFSMGAEGPASAAASGATAAPPKTPLLGWSEAPWKAREYSACRNIAYVHAVSCFGACICT